MAVGYFRKHVKELQLAPAFHEVAFLGACLNRGRVL
jgi:hypothetical protein